MLHMGAKREMWGEIGKEGRVSTSDLNAQKKGRSVIWKKLLTSLTVCSINRALFKKCLSVGSQAKVAPQ